MQQETVISVKWWVSHPVIKLVVFIHVRFHIFRIWQIWHRRKLTGMYLRCDLEQQWLIFHPFRDLKRDIARKLEKLERKTQKAIVELICEGIVACTSNECHTPPPPPSPGERLQGEAGEDGDLASAVAATGANKEARRDLDWTHSISTTFSFSTFYPLLQHHSWLSISFQHKWYKK